MTTDGNTKSTLFTNSAGVIATRVIVNQIAWHYDTGFGPNVRVALLHYNAAGYWSVLGLMFTNYTYGGALQFHVGTRPETFGYFNTNNAMDYFGVQRLHGQSANVQIGNQSANYIDAPRYAANVYNTINICPGQFWLGPSDVISLVGYSANGGSCTVGYSFTLISES
jgi:hypothetical protein